MQNDKIKTYEYYIINRLLRLENTVEVLEDRIKDYLEVIKDLTDTLNYIKERVFIQKAHDWSEDNPNTYIDIKSIWKKHDQKEYETICRLLELVEPTEEDE